MAALQPGDRLVRTIKKRNSTGPVVTEFEVVSTRLRGKTHIQNLKSGIVHEKWWRNTGDLPRCYRHVPRDLVQSDVRPPPRTHHPRTAKPRLERQLAGAFLSA